MTTSSTNKGTSDQAPAEAPKATASKDKPEYVVKYIGPASQRILTEEDWERVGAKGQKGVEWNFQNHFQVPVSEFNEEALKYLRDVDDRMQVIRV